MPHDVVHTEQSLFGVRELVAQGRCWLNMAESELVESAEASDETRRVRLSESARCSIEMARKVLAAAECDLSALIPVDPTTLKAKKKATTLKGGID